MAGKTQHDREVGLSRQQTCQDRTLHGKTGRKRYPTGPLYDLSEEAFERYRRLEDEFGLWEVYTKDTETACWCYPFKRTSSDVIKQELPYRRVLEEKHKSGRSRGVPLVVPEP